MTQNEQPQKKKPFEDLDTVSIKKSDIKKVSTEAINQIKIKKLGLKLLAESIVQLEELNTFLLECSPEEITISTFLQLLLKAGKIKETDFAALEKSWLENTETQENYQMRELPNRLEFYIEA